MGLCSACSVYTKAVKDQVHLLSNCINGHGPITAEILIVGEAPGADEDQAGMPFVGRAGQKLNECLVKAGLDRGTVRVTNACRCRPVSVVYSEFPTKLQSKKVQNRAPTGQEIITCSTLHLDSEIRSMPNLKIIMPLGNSALFAVHGRFHVKKAPDKVQSKITTMRGVPFKSEEYGVIILPSYHPAYILRSPQLEKYLIKDLALARDIISGRKKQPGEVSYVKITTPQLARKLFKFLKSSGKFSWDTETTSKDSFYGEKIIAFSFSVAPRKAAYLPFWEGGQITKSKDELKNYWLEKYGWDVYEEIVSLLKDVMEDENILKIGHNLMFDAKFIYASMGADGNPLKINMKGWYFDTMVAHFMLYETEPHDLKSLAAFFTDLGLYDSDLDNEYKEIKKKVAKINTIRKEARKLISLWEEAKVLDNKAIKKLNDFYGLSLNKKSSPEDIDAAIKTIMEFGVADLEPHYGMIPLDVLSLYAMKDADATMRLYLILNKKMEEKDTLLKKTFHELRMQMCRRLVQAELAGICVDSKLIDDTIQSFAEKQKELENFIKNQVGLEELNIASVVQLRRVLYSSAGEGGLGLKAETKTKTGQDSTDKKTLDRLYQNTKNDVLKAIIEWRHLQNLRSTFLEGMKSSIDPITGRIHPTFRVAQAATQRVVCSKPNLLNIPRDDSGSGDSDTVKIRNIFIPEPHNPNGPIENMKVFVDGDLSQAELRVFAGLSGDEKMKDLMHRGVDIHSYFANIIYKLGLPEDELYRIKQDPEMKALRSRTKNMVFGCVTLDCEILTHRGWLKFHELKKEDKAVVFDFEHQCMTYGDILDKVYYTSAPVVNVTFPLLGSIKTTPNHRWLVMDQYRKLQFKTSEELTSLPHSYFIYHSTRFINTDSKFENYSYEESKLLAFILCYGLMCDEYGNGNRSLYIAVPTENINLLEAEMPECYQLKHKKDVNGESIFEVTGEYLQSFLDKIDFPDGMERAILNWPTYHKTQICNTILSIRGKVDSKNFIHMGNGSRIHKNAMDLLFFLDGRSCGMDEGGFYYGTSITPAVGIKIKNAGVEDVWCVKTSCDNWVVRSGGLITLTGNTLYGQNEYGAEKTLGIPKEEAKKIIDTFFSLCPKGKMWIEEQKNYARKHGYVKTPLGVYRHLPELLDPGQDPMVVAEAERVAVNSPIQTHASDYNCLAFLDICNELDSIGVWYEPKVLVYDSIIIECMLKDAELVASVMKKNMTKKRFGYDMDMDCDIDIVTRWSGKSIDVKASLNSKKLVVKS